MAPTILIVGATGNTGRSVVECLPGLLQKTNLASARILALTRSASNPTAQTLTKKYGVEIEEKNWVEIDETWLRERHVVRAFIASHNEPTQFADESQFLVNALRAGVEYVVRISTTATNVHPDFPGYYTRSHWAIENLLDQPEFNKLKSTSLQPNAFPQTWLAGAAALIKSVRETGKQTPLRMLLNEDSPIGLVDAHDVGAFAAHLLAAEEVAPHNGKRYVLNGPANVTGKEVVAMIEKYIAEPVRDVRYGDVTVIDDMVESYPGSKNLLLSLKHAPVNFWKGLATTSTTSKEVFDIYAPKITAAQSLESMLH